MRVSFFYYRHQQQAFLVVGADTDWGFACVDFSVYCVYFVRILSNDMGMGFMPMLYVIGDRLTRKESVVCVNNKK